MRPKIFGNDLTVPAMTFSLAETGLSNTMKRNKKDPEEKLETSLWTLLKSQQRLCWCSS